MNSSAVQNPATAPPPRSWGRKKQVRLARLIIALLLLAVAVLGLIGFVLQVAKSASLETHSSQADNWTESMLALVWFTSSLSATIVSRELRSPFRQIVFPAALMLTVLSILFWFLVVVV
jgi:hypothetical protein